MLAGFATTLGGFPIRSLAQTASAAGIGPSSRRFFSFLHTYEATGRYWNALEKVGLIRPTSGVRLVHSPWGDDSRRFNTVTAADGALHRILKDRRCPFVVDRVVGGSPYHSYVFDQQLIQTYAQLLGDKFLGGQVHEAVCNVHNDWSRIVSANKKFGTQAIRPDELRDSQLYLEYGTLDDYAGRTHPKTGTAWWREIEWAARREAARVANHFSYCEGSEWGWNAWPFFYRLGAQYCLAEVGVWASTQSQWAIASLRGAAKAAGRPWGIFFAPWGPGGCTSFIAPKDWSWQAPADVFQKSGLPVGPDLGASSALQRRIFFHAYLSGAWTLHEEWGAEGNLLDWGNPRLSSYGRVTHDLLDFQDANPDVGEPYTPLALVLEARFPAPVESTWPATIEKVKASLFAYGPQDSAYAARKDGGKPEADCYAPCVAPEVFDLVPSDAPQAVWDRYQRIIAIGNVPSPAGAKVVPAEDQVEAILQAIKDLSPFDRGSRLPMQINHRAADGAWIVGLYNPWGANRGDVDNTGSLLDDGCAQQDVIRAKSSFKNAQILHAWPAGSRMEVRGDELHVTVGPGGSLVLEII